MKLPEQPVFCRIAKTLSFMAGGKPILIVTAGDAKIDNAKYKAKFGAKAKMHTPDEAEELIGHAVGGVCPFGIKAGVDVYRGSMSVRTGRRWNDQIHQWLC